MVVRLLSILTLLVITLPAGADIYRWVDKDGKVYFSDEKPENQTSERITIVTPAIPAVPDEGELRRLDLLKQAEENWRQREAESIEIEAYPPIEARGESACRNARINYGVLKMRMAVYQTKNGDYRPHWYGDTYRGKRNYVSDNDREAVHAAVEGDIYRYCDDPTNVDALNSEFNRWVDSEYCAVARVELASAENERSRTPGGRIKQLRQEVQELCN